MRRLAPDDILLLVGAFQSAWLSLLQDERVLAGNVDRLPGLLMTAVLDAASDHGGDEERLAAAALRQLDLYEDQLESVRGPTLQ
jgi:hypothetical protein